MVKIKLNLSYLKVKDGYFMFKFDEKKASIAHIMFSQQLKAFVQKKFDLDEKEVNEVLAQNTTLVIG